MDVRTPQVEEFDALAYIWYQGWRDAHANLLPDELVRIRTIESFRDRLPALLSHTRVIGKIGVPLGFSVTKDDELYQLFVAAEARGTGAAQKLIADVEERLASNGVETAWLACAIGNERAARFYEKCGWHLAGTFVIELPVDNGIFPLEVWRYEKGLCRTNSTAVRY